MHILLYTPNAWNLAAYQTITSGTAMTFQTSYDNGMRPTSLTYPDGTVIAYQYDGLGRLTEIPKYATDGQYNYMGRLASMRAPNETRKTVECDDGNPG